MTIWSSFLRQEEREKSPANPRFLNLCRYQFARHWGGGVFKNALTTPDRAGYVVSVTNRSNCRGESTFSSRRGLKDSLI